MTKGGLQQMQMKKVSQNNGMECLETNPFNKPGPIRPVKREKKRT
jgi:hypothetical protein